MKHLLFLLLLPFATSAQILLTNTTHTLKVTTSSTSGIDYRVAYFDETATGAGLTTSSVGKITTATTTTVLAAPSASTTRTVNYISLTNVGAATNTVVVKVDVSGTEYNETPTYTLLAGESIYYNVSVGWTRSLAVESTITGTTRSFGKTGTVSDATSYHYGFWKDAGVQGAWAPGTPGLSGRTTEGTSATDAGCIFFPNAGAGKTRYLTQATMSATTPHAFSLWDVVWVNSGVVVTTTTAQTITSVAFPPRDDNNSSNGDGYQIGIYATAQLNNAAIVSNSIITYTNSAGVGSRTATLSATNPNNFPAVPVIGTVVWFQLQAGDIGVRSIESITLNTTLTSGSLSMFVARKLVGLPVAVANVNFINLINNGMGVVLPNDACILPFAQTSAATATVINGTLTTVER